MAFVKKMWQGMFAVCEQRLVHQKVIFDVSDRDKVEDTKKELQGVHSSIKGLVNVNHLWEGD